MQAGSYSLVTGNPLGLPILRAFLIERASTDFPPYVPAGAGGKGISAKKLSQVIEKIKRQIFMALGMLFVLTRV